MARVVNLLEEDAELTRTTGAAGEIIMSVAGEVKQLASVVRIMSTTGRAELVLNGKPAGSTPATYTVAEGEKTGTVRAEYRWPDGTHRVFTIALSPGVNADALASPEGMERRWSEAYTVRRGLAIKGMSPANGTKTENKRPRFRWNAAAGASTYQLQIAKSRYALSETASIAVSGVTYTPPKPLDGTYYWRVRAVDGDGQAGVWSAATSVRVVGYAVGARGPAGGIVFYDKGRYSDGWRYLEAARSDHATSVEWGGGYKGIGGTSTAIGSGKANTQRIVNKLGSGSAARICYDLVLGGYDDWFLPSRDELNELYKQRKLVGSFASYFYWSSSEYVSASAWGQFFGSGYQDDKLKRGAFPVRAVRAF